MKELTIQEMHSAELDILKVIDGTCRKLGLRYFVAYGTLIGVARHQGFIPWDDDLDIMMYRDDMNKLVHYMEVHENEIAPYKIYTPDNNNKYPYGIPRVCNTEFKVLHKNKADCDMGMFVDIYPLDPMGDTLEEGMADYKKIDRLIRICYFLTDEKYAGANGTLKSIIKYPLYVYAKIRGLNFYLNKILNISKKYWKNNSKYVGVTIWGDVRYKYERSWFGRGIRMPFEDMMVLVPENYDAVLRCSYGDYMKLPPAEKQHPTHSYVAYHK